jgi:hypothetical protein
MHMRPLGGLTPSDWFTLLHLTGSPYHPSIWGLDLKRLGLADEDRHVQLTTCEPSRVLCVDKSFEFMKCIAAANDMRTGDR